MLNVFYRISDKSYEKAKLLGCTKEFCLNNLFEEFNKENIIILADNCTSQTLEWLKGFGKTVVSTNLGNAGSARKAIEMACELPPDELVYFAEDDYIYRNLGTPCPRIIEESLAVVHYSTLYDHPDKYQAEYGFGETSKVFRTRHSHWRQTISTTMTFATRVGTLQEDLDIWNKHTNGQHPWDHLIFCELTAKQRILAVCIPGLACHVDLTYSASKHNILIEDWAIEMMDRILASNLKQKADPSYCKIAHLEPSMQKLAMLWALNHQSEQVVTE